MSMMSVGIIRRPLSVNNLLSTTSPPKPLNGLSPNSTGMILKWPLFPTCSKNYILCRILVAIATKMKNLKIFLSKPTGPWVTLYLRCCVFIKGIGAEMEMVIRETTVQLVPVIFLISGKR